MAYGSVVAVNVNQGPTITLASGRIFDFLDPHGSDFTIDDIAHGLANICRYAGQCREFYSVAEHSLLVSDVASECPYEALLHDASEAFIGDITRPLKQLLPEYKAIEANVANAVEERFGFNAAYRNAIKAADLSVLAAEQSQIMAAGTDNWVAEAGIIPAQIVVKFLDPTVARKSFLKRFYELRP